MLKVLLFVKSRQGLNMGSKLFGIEDSVPDGTG
jgi:hypothetical protein